MNASRLISMVGRMVMRRLISRGVNAGIDKAFGSKSSGKPATPEERLQQQAAKKNAQRSKKAIRVARRFGKF
ncbi:hypothetical protein [Palleronia abyssalis]|uniref:Uncharacterized protein n=1 Tax=Palleronia abyssalis TaxID=1501240 RepID=A0A2R8BRP6_9RHOB|nr:hypothetical protein [Palleronia abyssalis]SPJ22775.1 hypothetical protein PAA8504_00573 [Palleronia abyssalis]